MPPTGISLTTNKPTAVKWLTGTGVTEPPDVNFFPIFRDSAQTLFERSENFFDSSFGGADNPLRHLGALGLYFLWILVATGLYVRLYPGSGPAGPRCSWVERLRALLDVWPVLLIFVLVIGGIYGGVFTPTEAAAVGALGTGVIAVTKGMRLGGLMDCLYVTDIGTSRARLLMM